MSVYRLGTVSLGMLAMTAGLSFGARQGSKEKTVQVPANQNLPTKASLVGHNIQSLEETSVQLPSGPPVKGVVIQGCLEADDERQIQVHA